MKHRFTLLVVAPAASGVTYLTTYMPKTWDLTVYADKSDLGDEAKWTRRFGFRSLEECQRSAATSILVLNRKRASLPQSEQQGAPTPDYECAYSCKPMFPGSGVHVCDTTTR